MKDLSALKDCSAKKYVGFIKPNIHTRMDSSTVYFELVDTSEIEFELRTGQQIPRVYAKNADNLGKELVSDLKHIECMSDKCSFHFMDGSKFDIVLEGLNLSWTKFPRNIGRIPRIIIASEEAWAALSVFIGNAFPSGVSKIVEGCSQKSAILFGHARTVVLASIHERSRFRDILNGNTNLPSPLIDFKGEEIQIELESILLDSAVHGFLISLKALLDIYALLVARTIGIKGGASFSKAKVGGVEISGGSLINTLRKSCPKSYSQGNELANVLEKHSNEWISNRVAIRDQATHQTHIQTYGRICIFAKKNSISGIYELNEYPITIEDVEINTYFNETLVNLKRFVCETIAFLPGVNINEMNMAHYGGSFIKSS